ncbi:hypothetical protein [Methylorubrum populi]
MTLIVTANIAGQTRGEPVRLPDRRRRRLSTIIARHRPPAGRRFIVSVHRRGETFLRPTDAAVRLRASWRNTLVEPGDTVLFTVVPLGGKGLSIGLTIASLALIVLAPYAAPAIAAGIGLGASTAAVAAVQAGLVIGGAALGYAAQASAAAKKKTERSLSSVTGGGNVPKPGARKPLLYGRCWSTPPLSQKDFFAYDGDTMVLTKRMTLGIGRFQIHAVHVGEAVFWTEAGGIQAPFTSTVGPLGTAIEFLYGQPSTLAPGDVIASLSVGGQELPRPGGNPDWTPWFRLTPQGVTADAAQMSWTYPAIYRVSSQGRQVATVAGVVFQGQELDPTTGQPIGPVFELWRSSEGATALTTQPLRRSAYFRLPKNGTYQVRAQNMIPEAVGFEQKNAASWDEMAAIKDDVRIRPATTEIVMRVRAGKGLTVTAFSEIWVDATRILPVYDKATQTWTERANQSATASQFDGITARVGGVEAGLATEVKARADAVSAQADRTDRLVAQTNSDRAYFLASEKARIDTEGALSQQISGLGTRVGSSETAISDLRTAQSNQTSAQASTNTELYARTDAGTAYGQFAMGAVSAPDGVSARIACFAGTDRNGTKHNGGWFIDVLPNNTARFVIDATLFAITANGGMTYPFTFDGTTLTIPKLKVTQEAILPGATTDPFSFVTPGEIDAGASSDEWREIPGTGYSLTPDGPGWSIFFSGVARAQVTAVGTAYLYLSSSIQIAIGVDGVPYGGGGFFTLSAGSGAGAAPIPNTNTSGLTYSNAGLEILAAYQPRRFSLLYKFKADPGSSGKILYGQLKVVVIKR